MPQAAPGAMDRSLTCRYRATPSRDVTRATHLSGPEALAFVLGLGFRVVGLWGFRVCCVWVSAAASSAADLPGPQFSLLSGVPGSCNGPGCKKGVRCRV